MTKKVALIILDWFGLTDIEPDRNAIVQAKTPTFDYLFSKTYAKISTKDCLIILPVPSVACQTSEFHICPSGKPAARHDADILA